ncbi:VOC family protein [Flavihumibacter profundi]|jgi:catechol 2,3-dioxygenase-like lactoylglutathione lyase family enzyme|uniref:VOC family protein n=1 Tax=Flavihumibacter profundi TaxID=2716883 RepID=UPI001CC824BD|nr:VOC family protein [Flavihumibacter profundi]MBZ5856804.1 VOC family protein [Flavihumibacter profundi]
MKQEIKINKLQHIGIPVTNIEVSELFYRSLGFNNVLKSGFKFDGQNGTCIMMQQKDIIIELYQMPEKQLSEIRLRKDGHVDHIAFDVDDIGATFEILKNSGYTILEEQPVFLSFWKNGCKYFNILGPDGERLEFNQIM